MRALSLALALAAATTARAQQPVNPIHPTFAPLDEGGRKVQSGAQVSADRTCGGCHDAGYIASHSGHASGSARATCIQCHVDGGRLDLRPETLDESGMLRRDAIRIGTPRAANCGACHGLLSDSAGRVLVPPDFEAAGEGGRTFMLTQGEGAIVSPEHMSDSFLNLVGKAGLSTPWDVHAAKLVDCVACHFAANNPARVDAKQAALRYLVADPRRPSTAEFLVRPDHRFAEQGCRGCHDPLRAHEFLPYRARHMEVLACPSCHLSAPRGPALEMIDATVATPEGRPVARYRNVERATGETLNTSPVRAFRPLLVERADGDGAVRLIPVNPVGRWRWISRADGTEIPFERVAKVFLAEGGQVVGALDSNGDGKLDGDELRLDSEAKVQAIAGRLRALGVVDPAIEGSLTAFPLAHGVTSREGALRDCAECHAPSSRLADAFLIASYLPGGEPPKPKENGRIQLAGTLARTPSGGLELRRDPHWAPGRTHVLGHSREGWSNAAGFAIFVAVAAGVAVHAFARLATRKRRGAAVHRGPEVRNYAFSRYERFWHWTMAFSGIALIATGLEIHNSGRHWLMELATAVSVHNVLAAVLMANAAMALGYHLATRAIRNFIPEPRGLLGRILEHMEYMSRGIFLGQQHPSNPAGKKLNPLQQITYLALLNLLFPLQIATGLLIWAVGHWPDVARAVGGLTVVAPLHNLGAWLFLSFLVLHVYLVTTGRTLGEHLKAMITGYQVHEATTQSTSRGAEHART